MVVHTRAGSLSPEGEGDTPGGAEARSQAVVQTHRLQAVEGRIRRPLSSATLDHDPNVIKQCG